MEELKACPFCGKIDSIVVSEDTPRLYAVVCTGMKGGCGARTLLAEKKKTAIVSWNGRKKQNGVLTLEEMRTMEGGLVWIEFLDRPDLSRWHFIVQTKLLGLIAKDGLGQYERYPHNEGDLLSGCYLDIEHGHNYGVNWLAYRHKLVR